jgi:hypothetical protein
MRLYQSSSNLRCSDSHGTHTQVDHASLPGGGAGLCPFRRALRRSDQLVLDDLFAAARQHIAAAAYASHALPFEVFLLSMLLEEHKEVVRLRQIVEAIQNGSSE